MTNFVDWLETLGLSIWDVITETLRLIGKAVLEQENLPSGMIGDAFHNIAIVKTADTKIDDYMRLNPNMTYNQARIEVYLQDGVICQEGYDLIMENFKPRILNYDMVGGFA